MPKYRLFTTEPQTWSTKSVQQSRRYFKAFVSAIPDRLAQLSTFVSIDWVRSPKPISQHRAELIGLEKFFRTMPLWEYHEPMGDRASIVVLNQKKREELQRIEQRAKEAGDWDLSPQGVSIARDLSVLLGEYFRIRTPTLRWAIDELAGHYFFGSTYLRNHELMPQYEMHAHQYAYTMILNARTESKSLADAIIDWIELISKHGPTVRIVKRARSASR